MLDEFGLAGLRDARADQLSFGQRKLLEFASVLMGDPRLVLLDEPTSGVNPVMVETMERHIRELHARGLTFLIVEHAMPTVMRLCDPVIVLDHGAKIAEGAPAAVQSDPRRPRRVPGHVSVLELSRRASPATAPADVLRGVDLALEPGTITCLVGPNGAGKSTVLRTISGLLRPRQGAIMLDGADISGLSPGAVLRKGIVHVPQERGLFAGMTVWENVLIGAHIVRDAAEVRRRAGAVAERFAIVAERRGDRAGSLSGGQQKIVEIARALMLEPRLILMDEPSMGLDPKARHLVFETITALNRDEGHTILLVEQNARAGLGIAHRGAVMDAGAVAIAATGAELLADPRMAQLYLGGHARQTA